MPFEIKNEKVLEKYKSIWNKINNIMEKEFEKQLVNDRKRLKSKLKSQTVK